MTAFDDVQPTVGDVANSYELILDINTGTEETPEWANIPDITAFNPQPSPKQKDITTYAHKGTTSQQKSGEDFSVSFNLLKVRDEQGEFQPEWITLKEAADADGEANNVLIRYYDALGASDAYQVKCGVARALTNNGNDDPGFDTFTLTGVTRRVPIVNPVTETTPEV